MTDNPMSAGAAPAIATPSAAHRDAMFPALTPAQLARVAAHGKRRPIAAGEVLVEVGEALHE
jgi:hypothetical protein